MCCDLVLSFQMVNPLFGSDLYLFYHLIFSCALTSRAVPVHFQAIHSFSVDAPYCLSACFICLLYDCVHYHGSPRERWFNPSPCALKGPLFLCFSGHRTWRCVCVCVYSEFVKCVLWCKSSLWRFIGQKEWPSRLFTLYPVSPSQLAGARSDELSARWEHRHWMLR